MCNPPIVWGIVLRGYFRLFYLRRWWLHTLSTCFYLGLWLWRLIIIRDGVFAMFLPRIRVARVIRGFWPIVLIARFLDSSHGCDVTLSSSRLKKKERSWWSQTFFWNPCVRLVAVLRIRRCFWRWKDFHFRGLTGANFVLFPSLVYFAYWGYS